jgi:hypothetical protein
MRGLSPGHREFQHPLDGVAGFEGDLVGRGREAQPGSPPSSSPRAISSAGQVLAEALVGAEAEGHVMAGRAVSVQGVGLGVDGRVAVDDGGREKHAVAGADHGGLDIDVVDGHTPAPLRDGQHPHQLLDGGGQQRGVGAQLGEALGVPDR